MALRSAGFSLGEIRAMPMADYLAYCDLLAEQAPPAVGEGPRRATQEDIDRLLS